MEQATVARATEEILQGIYKNIKMAEDAILDLMPRVKDEALKSDLTVQLATYEAFASRTAKLLEREGAKPVAEGALTRLSAKWGTMMNAMKDSSSTHLAEMVVEGATMGSTICSPFCVTDAPRAWTRTFCAWRRIFAPTRSAP